MTVEADAARVSLQDDYGGFNPRFLGVSVYYDSPESYNSVYRFMVGEGDGDEETGLHDIVLRSVMDHEARHYHDFLLSPYSIAIFRIRLMALANAVQALSTAKEIDGDVLPVPITRWALMSETARDDAEAGWRQDLGRPARAVGIPAWTREDLGDAGAPGASVPVDALSDVEKFEAYVEMAARAYVRIDQLTQGFAATDDRPYLRPVYVHEASALTVQLAAVHAAQGEWEAVQFVDFLLNAELPQARMWVLVYQLASQLERMWSRESGPFAGIRRILSITTWAMLGDYDEERQNACPVGRLMALLERVVADPDDRGMSGDVDDPDDLGRMWDRWDKELGTVSWRDSLSRLVASTQRGIEAYRELASKWKGESGVPEHMIRALERVLHDQRVIAAAVEADPRVMAVAESYVGHDGRLPNPDVRIEYRGFALESPQDLPGRAVTRAGPDGRVYATGSVIPSDLHDPERLAALDDKLRAENVIEWCDFAFSSLSVPDHVVASSRRGIQEVSAKTVLQLI
jgi:hypothetical protein